MGTEKKRAFLIHTAYYLVWFMAAFLMLRYLFPMLAPFVIAFVVAWFLKRPIDRLVRTLHVPWKPTAILMVLAFYGIIGILLFLLGLRAVTAISDLVVQMPTMYETHARPFFMGVLTNVEAFILRLDPSLVAALDAGASKVLQSLGQKVSDLSVTGMAAVSGLATTLPSLFIKLVLMIISTFFIAIDYKRLTGFCMQQMSDGAKEVFIQVKKYMVGTLFVCIRSYLLIMSITFVELSVGLSILKVRHALLVAFFIAMFDILPVLGTGGIMIPWAVLTVIRGDLVMGLKLFVLYLIITVIRNIIEPKIVGGQLGLHPVITLSSMFAGAQLLGVVGLFGFPIVLSLLCHLDRNGTIRLFRKPQE